MLDSIVQKIIKEDIKEKGHDLGPFTHKHLNDLFTEIKIVTCITKIQKEKRVVITTW